MNVIADGAEKFFGEPPGAGLMVSSEWFGMNTFDKILNKWNTGILLFSYF